MSRVFPNLGLIGAWGNGYSGWDGDMDRDLLTLSSLSQMVALSYTTFLPGAPTQGMVYLIPGSAGVNPNKIAIYDNAAWVYLTPLDGWSCYLTDAKRVVTYSSSLATWVYQQTFPESVGSLSHRNLLINPSMDIAQRGNTFTTSGFSADRWLFTVVSGSWTSNIYGYPGGTDLPEGTSKYLSLASAGAGVMDCVQRVEGVRRKNGRTVTFSAYIRVGAGAATVGAAMAQNFGTGGSATVSLTGATVVPTGAFVRYTWTFNLPSTAAATIATDGSDFVAVALVITTTGAANVHVGCMQLEEGGIATPLERHPIATELAMCQRYYYRRVSSGVHDVLGLFSVFSTTQVWGKFFDLPVEMRIPPTMNLSSTGELQVWPANGGSPGSVSSIVGGSLQSSTRSVNAFSGLNTTLTGLTLGQALFLTFLTTTAWIDASAEF